MPSPKLARNAGELTATPSAARAHRRGDAGARRERLLAAMMELCTLVGYPQTTVRSLSVHAGVSTASFYELFPDREACLIAACRVAAQRLFGDLPSPGALGGSEPLRVTLEALLSAFEREPYARQLLFVSSLAGRTPARRERERALAGFERALHATLAACAPAPVTLDLPAGALTGALCELTCGCSSGTVSLPALAEDLLIWVRAFARGDGAPPRRIPAAGVPGCGEPSTRSREACRRTARTLPRGRHRLPSEIVAGIHRERLIHAVADVTLALGYEDLTVTGIVAAAGVARSVFYRHFTSKQDAFLAAQDFAAAELTRRLARTYFEPRAWPQRVFRVLEEITGLIAANPGLAHLRLVESYAAGRGALCRVEQLRAAAAILLFEGFSHTTGPPVPRRVADASAGAVFELLQRELISGDGAIVRRRLPELTFIALAPFTGAERALQLVGELSAGEPGTVG